MPKKAPPPPPRVAPRIRFSAPCNVGPPLPGAKAGDVLEVEGGLNAGSYRIDKVDADWMSVTERVIEDEANPVGVEVKLVPAKETKA